MSSSASLFRQLSALREAAGIPFFSTQRLLDVRVAESGGPVPVNKLISYAKLVGATIEVVEPGSKVDIADLKSKVLDLEDLAATLDETLTEKAKVIKSLQAKVRRLEKKAAK